MAVIWKVAVVAPAMYKRVDVVRLIPAVSDVNENAVVTVCGLDIVTVTAIVWIPTTMVV